MTPGTRRPTVAFVRQRGKSWYAYWDEYSSGKRIPRAKSLGTGRVGKKAAEDFVLLKNADQLRAAPEPSMMVFRDWWKRYEQVPHVRTAARRVHPDEYVVVPDRRLFDVSELQNVGRAVSILHDGLHCGSLRCQRGPGDLFPECHGRLLMLEFPHAASQKGGYRSVTRRSAYPRTRSCHRITP
jgi:hypothetical protein